VSTCTPEASATEYRPRRALIEVVDPIDEAELDPVPAPAFQPAPSAGAIPSTLWAAPVGPPVVEDLAAVLWQPAALGATIVAKELDRLKAADGRWTYLNSIPGGKKGSEIDHLVIGPGGVFTVNAGRHSDARVRTGGEIRIGRQEAQRVAQLLTSATRICIRVRGLIVPVSTGTDVVKQHSNIVEIVSHSALVDYLRSQPTYLDGATRARITGYARLSSTWRPAASSSRRR
jgi:hypothetical protein